MVRSGPLFTSTPTGRVATSTVAVYLPPAGTSIVAWPSALVSPDPVKPSGPATLTVTPDMGALSAPVTIAVIEGPSA